MPERLLRQQSIRQQCSTYNSRALERVRQEIAGKLDNPLILKDSTVGQ